MKAFVLRKETPDALRRLLRDKLIRVEELSLLAHQKKLKNVKELRAVKKDIARIKTILRGQAL